VVVVVAFVGFVVLSAGGACVVGGSAGSGRVAISLTFHASYGVTFFFP
jgi:hypothetical protein